MENLEQILYSNDYKFLWSNEHLGNEHLILIGLGGSYAYGTNVEGSDIDLRGIALNSKKEILGVGTFEQIVDNKTDTTIYSFKKIIQLLTNCNPNVIEILGLKPEHYLYLTKIGEELLANKKLFLSKKAAHTFAGYAFSQLRRLDNKAVRTVTQADRERHILNSINSSSSTWPEKYNLNLNDDSIKLYLDTSFQDDFEKEIFMDVNLKHYPLRDYCSLWAEMKNIVSEYAKIGRRNNRAIERGKLGKHMMHLIRLYLMCLDILEREEIITYREKDRSFLLEVRNGKFLDENSQPIPEFYDLVNDFEKRLTYAVDNTCLPSEPDYKKINDFVLDVNERIVLNKL